MTAVFPTPVTVPMVDNAQDRLYQLVSTVLRVAVALAVAVLVVPPVAGAVAAGTLLNAPLPVGELPEKRPMISAVPSTVYDAAGRQIGLFRGFDQTVEITPDQIPQVLKDAVVAIEDKRFWQHDGVDYEGIVRAARVNLEVGGIAQGGSTLTQQYVKNVYLSNERTIERKLEEALLATELEKTMSKEEILFGYLTTSYFGSGAYGIGAAAEIYFGKPVSELDISEAATLAGVVKAPTSTSPYVDRDAADQRRRLVLQAMYDQGYISAADYEREAARRLWSQEDPGSPDGPVTLLVPRQKKGAIHYPFFVDYVEAELLERLGPDPVYQGGLRIETSIVPEYQEAAESAVARRLGNTEYPIEMALASVDPATGHVVAMVGGRDYEFSQVNLATGGSTGFQPGSSFKPIVLATAFVLGLNPDTAYPAPGQWIVPGCTGDQCTISNYDYRNYGRLTLREAMRASVNTVFAQLVLDVGLADTVELARRLGLETYDPDGVYGPSLALGAVETSPLAMASAYGTFANRGVRVAPTGILRVIDADGNVLIDNRARSGERVLDTAVADNITDVLVDVIADGTGQRAQIGRPAAGKTGTAQAYRAAWFAGYTPDLATAVWMGHADRLAPLRGVNGVGRVTGGSHPAVAWADFMAAAHEGLEVSEFPEPEPIVPIAKTAEEMASFRVREFTRLGPRQRPVTLGQDCGGQSCRQDRVPTPQLARSQAPTTVPPPGSDDGVDGSAPSSSTTTSSPSNPPTTEPGSGGSTTTPSSSPSTTTPSTDSSSSTGSN